MDNFKKAQLHDLGKGGIKCYCCNDRARRRRTRGVDKALNRAARAKMKSQTIKELKNLE